MVVDVVAKVGEVTNGDHYLAIGTDAISRMVVD